MSLGGNPSDGAQIKVHPGETPTPEELLSYLSVPEGSLRAERFAALATTFAEVGKIAQAAMLARRAFIVSKFDRRYLDTCTALLAQCGDIDGVREILKRGGVAAANEGRVVEALDLFNRSLYVYANLHQRDRYVYDFEMLAAIEAMAQPYKKLERTTVTRERARIAVLVFGALHIGSVILKILATFAEHADRSRFELAFFVPEAKRAVSQSKSAQEQLAALERPGWSVYVPRSNDPLAVLLDTANAIHEWAPDVLLTSALCADLRHYFIASTRPAHKTVGLVQGPPPQFTAPWLDWNIAMSVHPGLDTPGNCTVVPLEFALPSVGSVTAERREQLGLPANCKIVASAGRPNKFESGDYWRTIANMLSSHPDVLYMAIGIDRLPEGALEHLNDGLKDRVRLVNWRKDYLGVLALSDVVLDTYPSGGGVVLLDAMALGIPVVSMANDYLHEFDQTDWGLGNEFVPIPELVAPRHDFVRQVEIVDRLLADPTHRAQLGRECESLVRSQRGSPARMIGRWEGVLASVVARPRIGSEVKAERAVASWRGGWVGQMLRWIRGI